MNKKILLSLALLLGASPVLFAGGEKESAAAFYNILKNGNVSKSEQLKNAIKLESLKKFLNSEQQAGFEQIKIDLGLGTKPAKKKSYDTIYHTNGGITEIGNDGTPHYVRSDEEDADYWANR